MLTNLKPDKSPVQQRQDSDEQNESKISVVVEALLMLAVLGAIVGGGLLGRNREEASVVVHVGGGDDRWFSVSVYVCVCMDGCAVVVDIINFQACEMVLCLLMMMV